MTLPSSLRFTTISAMLDGTTYINDVGYSTTDSANNNSGEKTLGTMAINMSVDNSFDSGKTDGDLYLTCAAGLRHGSSDEKYYNTVYRLQLPKVTASISAHDLDLGVCSAGSADVLQKNLPITVSTEFMAGRLKWSSGTDASALNFENAQGNVVENTWYNYQGQTDDVRVSWKCQDKAGKYNYPITLTWAVE